MARSNKTKLVHPLGLTLDHGIVDALLAGTCKVGFYLHVFKAFEAIEYAASQGENLPLEVARKNALQILLHGKKNGNSNAIKMLEYYENGRPASGKNSHLSIDVSSVVRGNSVDSRPREAKAKTERLMRVEQDDSIKALDAKIDTLVNAVNSLVNALTTKPTKKTK